MTYKTKFILLTVALFGLISCKTSHLKNACIPETGMYKVAILYPNGENKTFDLEYYEQTHMPMMAVFLGDNLKFYEIDKGISGRTAKDKVPFVAIGYFYVQNISAYHQAIDQNITAILEDIKKYTNIQPVIQISEIKKLEHQKMNYHK